MPIFCHRIIIFSHFCSYEFMRKSVDWTHTPPRVSCHNFWLKHLCAKSHTILEIPWNWLLKRKPGATVYLSLAPPALSLLRIRMTNIILQFFWVYKCSTRTNFNFLTTHNILVGEKKYFIHTLFIIIPYLMKKYHDGPLLL